MKEIPLTRGMVALVDDADYERIACHRWRYWTNGTQEYAVRTGYDKEQGRQYTVLMHREIMDAPAGVDIDHWNGNGLDNRRENLRTCTRVQNCHNRHGRRRNTQLERSTSSRPATQYWGVYRNGRSFIATVGLNGKTNYLGSFKTPELAALAYNQAIIDAGLQDFAPLNVIPEAQS